MASEDQELGWFWLRVSCDLLQLLAMAAITSRLNWGWRICLQFTQVFVSDLDFFWLLARGFSPLPRGHLLTAAHNLMAGSPQSQ